MADTRREDDVQHGIDDDAHNDGTKALGLGAAGGGTVGAMAGAVLGPVGMAVGALIGGAVGSLLSGAAVDAVDHVDNDNTVSGLGTGATPDASHTSHSSTNTSNIGASSAVAGAASVAAAPSAGANRFQGDKTMASNTPKVPGFDPALHVGTMGTGSEARPVARADYDAMPEADKMRVQLIEEQLHVGKEMRQSGEVAVSKHVVSEQVQVPVTLQHEEVTITRREVNRPVAAGEATFDSQTIKVPVHEEVAVVTKTAHVAEEIEIEKRAVAEQKTITDTVRREELDVQGNPTGSVHVEGNTPRRN